MALILGDPLDDMGHFGTEVLLNLLNRRQRVFDDVVQQAGGDGDGIEPHVGQDARHLERVHQVRLAGMAHLPLVLQCGKHVGPAEELAFLVRGVGPHLLEKVFESNHCLWLGSRTADPAAENQTAKTVSNPSIGKWLGHSKASLTWLWGVHILGGFFSKIRAVS